MKTAAVAMAMRAWNILNIYYWPYMFQVGYLDLQTCEMGANGAHIKLSNVG
jgi:hypothetical protein